ncbi:MAG: SDR family oxidoreductase [Bacteroidota bacterium]|nr:SDR family oxidoreductase [Bacteroidota bacterium]
MKNAMRFSGKHVLISGAARGIGYEIAKHFGREGAMLSLFDNHRENLEAVSAEFKAAGFPVNSYTVDISVRAQVEDAVRSAESVKPIDILINNAGIAEEIPFLQMDETQWNKVLNINLTGMFTLSQVVCREMVARRKGVVVNMSSKNGLDGEFGYAHYNASKGGVIMLTKTMALELAAFGIRVNAVCPGYIQTPMSEAIDSPEFTARFVNRYIPLNRPGKPEEIAPVFLFLASDESSFITGQAIVADGGQLAGQKPGDELLAKVLE